MRIGGDPISTLLDKLYRTESRRIFATLIRLLGDFDLAEDALQEAFRAALEQWGEKGVPSNPVSWLISAGRFRAIDRLRRQARFNPLHPDLLQQADSEAPDPSSGIEREIEDDILRLIFICAHPALPPEARVAMTLREVCGLTTEEIARAFLVRPATLAQRIVRAKARIREEGIPFQVPPEPELPERLEAVMQVIYLVFNEGYYASSGRSVTRVDLSSEAIRLGRLLHELLPDPEVSALLGLMLLQQSRHAARSSSSGELVLLEDQDRSLWDRDMIEEGMMRVREALSASRPGFYTLQAAIAALHAEAKTPEETDWERIAGLYTLLLQRHPSPVVELNRAVALAMSRGPEEGLREIDGILKRGDLSEYSLAHSVRAEFCRRLGRYDEARSSWERALALARQEPERRFIQKKLDSLEESPGR